MALLNSDLTVWEVGYRWAGIEPRAYPLSIPLAVRDNFRNLLGAILGGELVCVNLSLEKRQADDELSPEFFIRTHLDKINECINWGRVPRRLLKWAILDRFDFMTWCERRAIALPEFWFPPGWKLDYEWAEREARATESPEMGEGQPAAEVREGELPEGNEARLRENQRARIACQQIAKALWRKNPGLTIAALVEHEAVQEHGGGGYYAPEVVRRWISQIAPEEVKRRRGRPRKNPTPAE